MADLMAPWRATLDGWSDGSSRGHLGGKLARLIGWLLGGQSARLVRGLC